MHLKFALGLLMLSVSTIAAGADALPLLSSIFGDNMVLQRGKPNTLWGWSTPGQQIQVEISGATATAVAGADGGWQLQIEPPPAGGPYEVHIHGPQEITLHNVLVGDVWLCGGQSNMELPLSRVNHGAEEISQADHPLIRLFKVGDVASYTAAATPRGTWKVCTPQSIAAEGGFSAVAYFFGRKLQSELNIPIGLVEDCVGGTPAESWMSPQTISTLSDFHPAMAEIDRLRQLGGPVYGNYIMPWYDEYDIGAHGKTWAADDLDMSDWKPVQIPGRFAELGVADVPSVCWIRKDIVLPDPVPAGDATLYLGEVERMETSYVNGQWVGASAWVENPRVYPVAHAILRPGRNTITVRVLKIKPDGGFMSSPDVLRLVLGDKTAIPLAGEWEGKLSVDARPPHPMPLGFENWPVMPTVLYQGMIMPITPLALTGAIWYQGEANFERAYQYRTLLPLMIADWRRAFGQGDFPFYIVSLPRFMQHRDRPGDDAWAELRQAQAETAEHVANCGLTVTVDTGDPDNIHPGDKIIVGNRLAALALARNYGENIPYAGPQFASMEALPGALKLHFNHTDGGLVVKGDHLGEFSVCGPDHQWHWAEASIDGDAVVVRSADVPDPIAARYAWQANPVATLYNGAGFPAAPFRTDDFPWSTRNQRPY
ncbi:MAG TPA: sialate O-acetylesterase [Tepidisphaeraceae bacterium]|nr:sialate O-acetylesterase [Tepidisphaeraceae bacterium]